MKHILGILFVCLSVFKISVVYTGQPEWLLWGDPHNITYDSDKHVWLNENTLSEWWRWSDPDSRERLLTPEKVPEKRILEISINSFWQRSDRLTDLPLAMVYGATQKRNSFVEEAIDSVDDSKFLDRKLIQYRPRETFCPITRALNCNDEANVYGYAGAAADDLILTMELERLECQRYHQWQYKT